MAKERTIQKGEQILYILINLREKENEKGIREIKVNKNLCKQIGIFSYIVKDTKERKTSRLFLINEMQDGEEVNLIYDEEGRLIGWQEEKDKEKNEIQVSKDIELNKQMLSQQLLKGNEREKKIQEEPNEDTNNDTTKAGEGRDLASKEHEDSKKNIEDSKLEVKKEENDNILINYKGEIDLKYKTKIKLDEIVNGYYLWEILQIEDKYKGRMPKGLKEASFRNGYLTIVDAEELRRAEEKAGKEPKTRSKEKIMAICTREGDLIELDETILKPEQQLSLEDQQRAEQTALRYRDGEEALKPQNQHQITKQVSYQIPDVSSKFGVAEDWGIQVDINTELQRNGTNPTDGNAYEISFWQESKNAPILEKQLQRNRYVQKFEAFNESAGKTKKELEQMEDLREKSPNETINKRKEHIEEIVDKAFKKYQDLDQYYNRRDITKMAKNLHNEGWGDKKILEYIGEELQMAEKVEKIKGAK